MRSLGDGSESLYGNACVVYRISNGEETAENRGEICYIQGDMCFPGHFDMCMLSDRLEQDNFHVSKATLYNTLDVLVDAGLVVRHQITVQSVQYELRIYADTHLHLVCTRCGAIRELRNSALKADMRNLKVSRFTPEYYCLYIYGLCSKCKFKLQRSVK